MNEQVSLLFREVADLPRAERESVFAVRNVSPELRAEVESLLACDTLSDHSVTECIGLAAVDAARVSAEGAQRYCGPYRLIRVLGSGGMGAVYLAERNDGEIEQRVAIKMLHAGADRPAWQERFLRERQLLAYLNHPSVARLLDAGHTGQGQPYLVMEYVEGAPIDASAAGKSLREQLTLFLKVCEGVAHAHQHLIIHRDLKPSNILVDSSGQPKLLDFGIAKLLDETSDQTKTVERLLTPGYASPEQLRGTIQTTATDVYSLGAVLYKMLTGRSPHESEAGEVQAIEIVAGTREIPPARRLNPSLRGDIDFILQKALRTEPQERYASVESFANDIRAFLDSKPVQARTGDTWYRTRKFLRRYWAPATAAALVVASLSVGLYTANHERAIAQQRFNEVRQLANKLFDIDAQVNQLPGNTKARQLIVDTSLAYLRRLSADAKRNPELALEIGDAYMRVARVQGVSVGPNLGQMDQAEQNLRIADGFVQSVLAAQPANRTAVLRAAQISHDRMLLARHQGTRRRDEALLFARKSAEWLERFNATSADKAEASALLTTYMNIADYYVLRLELDAALRLCQRGSGLARSFDRSSASAMFLWVSARILQKRGELDEALQAIGESVTLLEPFAANRKGNLEQSLNLAMVLGWQGRILGEDNGISLGRSEEAASSLERGFQVIDGIVHQDPNDQASRGILQMVGRALADILRHSDPGRALDVYDHVLRHLAEIRDNPTSRIYEVEALAASSHPLQRLGRGAEARQRLDAAFERLKQLKLYPAAKVAPGSLPDKALRALADFEAATGNLARAMGIYQGRMDQATPEKLSSETVLEDALYLSNAYRSMAAIHLRAGHPDMASALDERRSELWRRWDRRLPKNPFVLRQIAEKSVP
jgi:serine/threonine protein kinase